MSGPGASPLETLKRRQRATAEAKRLLGELRARLPDLPLELDASTTNPVGDEDGNLFIKTDGIAVLRVLGIANDLTRQLEQVEGIRLIARVWPRTIWCRRSARARPGATSETYRMSPRQALYSERDTRGNTLLCVAASHDGEHDFSDPPRDYRARGEATDDGD